MIKVSQHDVNEWNRCATHFYATGRNDSGHVMSVAAATNPVGSEMTAFDFDKYQAVYRAWLVFDEPKAA